jgi:hypothetical protein
MHPVPLPLEHHVVRQIDKSILRFLTAQEMQRTRGRGQGILKALLDSSAAGYRAPAFSTFLELLGRLASRAYRRKGAAV